MIDVNCCLFLRFSLTENYAFVRSRKWKSGSTREPRSRWKRPGREYRRWWRRKWRSKIELKLLDRISSLIRCFFKSQNDSDDETTPDFSADEYGEDFSNEGSIRNENKIQFSQEENSFRISVLCPEIVAERPKEHEGLSNIIIVDNIPKVDQSRFEKLKGAIAKVYSNCGTIRKAHYPLDSEGKTKGFAFFEFENEQLAAEAIKQTDGYRLDKSHTFAVCLMSDYERFDLKKRKKMVSDLFSLENFLLLPDSLQCHQNQVSL